MLVKRRSSSSWWTVGNDGKPLSVSRAGCTCRGKGCLPPLFGLYYTHKSFKLFSTVIFFCPLVIIYLLFDGANEKFHPLCSGKAGGSVRQTWSTWGQGLCPLAVAHIQLVLISNNFLTKHLQAVAAERLRVDDTFASSKNDTGY